jgi:hypothetical protein
MTVFEGGCHCGAVRYSIDRRPTWSMICHCRSCRKVSGAPLMGWVTSAMAALTFTMGAPKAYASSPGVTRGFCGTCGAQLTYAREDEPDSMDIATASLDQPDQFPPSHHSWTEHDIKWMKAADALPRYPRARSSPGSD